MGRYDINIEIAITVEEPIKEALDKSGLSHRRFKNICRICGYDLDDETDREEVINALCRYFTEREKLLRVEQAQKELEEANAAYMAAKAFEFENNRW